MSCRVVPGAVLCYRDARRSGADPFVPFEDLLRARLPSREEILREAKAQSAQRRLQRHHGSSRPPV